MNMDWELPDKPKKIRRTMIVTPVDRRLHVAFEDRTTRWYEMRTDSPSAGRVEKVINRAYPEENDMSTRVSLLKGTQIKLFRYGYEVKDE
jgi:hypothetical protein